MLTAEVARPRDAQYFGYRDMVEAFRASYGGQRVSMVDFDHFRQRFWEGQGDKLHLDDSADESDDEDLVKKHFRKALAQPTEATQMRISKFTLAAWVNEPNGASPFFTSEGVTLLHLLQELRAWDDED